MSHTITFRNAYNAKNGGSSVNIYKSTTVGTKQLGMWTLSGDNMNNFTPASSSGTSINLGIPTTSSDFHIILGRYTSSYSSHPYRNLSVIEMYVPTGVECSVTPFFYNSEPSTTYKRKFHIGVLVDADINSGIVGTIDSAWDDMNGSEGGLTNAMNTLSSEFTDLNNSGEDVDENGRYISMFSGGTYHEYTTLHSGRHLLVIMNDEGGDYAIGFRIQSSETGSGSGSTTDKYEIHTNTLNQWITLTSTNCPTMPVGWGTHARGIKVSNASSPKYVDNDGIYSSVNSKSTNIYELYANTEASCDYVGLSSGTTMSANYRIYSFANKNTSNPPRVSGNRSSGVFAVHNNSSSTLTSYMPAYFGDGSLLKWNGVNDTYSIGAYSVTRGVYSDTWVSHTAANGNKYFAITVTSNSISKSISMPVKKGGTYVFNMRTYSEVSNDGIAITTSSSITGGALFNVSALTKLSGLNKNGTYTYNPTSDGTVYIWFVTDSLYLGEVRYDGSGRYSGQDGYEFGDVEVVITEPPVQTVTTRTVTYYTNLNEVTQSASTSTSYQANGSFVMTYQYDYSVATDTTKLPVLTSYSGNYEFLGWNPSQNGSGTTYNTTSSYTLYNLPTTFYAQWKKKIVCTIGTPFVLDQLCDIEADGENASSFAILANGQPNTDAKYGFPYNSCPGEINIPISYDDESFNVMIYFYRANDHYEITVNLCDVDYNIQDELSIIMPTIWTSPATWCGCDAGYFTSSSGTQRKCGVGVMCLGNAGGNSGNPNANTSIGAASNLGTDDLEYEGIDDYTTFAITVYLGGADITNKNNGAQLVETYSNYVPRSWGSIYQAGTGPCMCGGFWRAYYLPLNGSANSYVSPLWSKMQSAYNNIPGESLPTSCDYVYIVELPIVQSYNHLENLSLSLSKNPIKYNEETETYTTGTYTSGLATQVNATITIADTTIAQKV